MPRISLPLLASGAALLLVSASVAAQPPAVAAKSVNLRAGPARDYPLIAQVGGGAPLAVQGCIRGYSWCDVIAPGGLRGWVYAGNISYPYQNNEVPLLQYGAVIGLPIVGFVLGNYWGDYYRNRPFYRDRDRWAHHPGFGGPPPGFNRPGGGPPPGFHPPGGGSPPGFHRPGDGPPPGFHRPGGGQPPRGPDAGGRPFDPGRPSIDHRPGAAPGGGRPEGINRPGGPQARPPQAGTPDRGGDRGAGPGGQRGDGPGGERGGPGGGGHGGGGRPER